MACVHKADLAENFFPLVVIGKVAVNISQLNCSTYCLGKHEFVLLEKNCNHTNYRYD